MLSLSLVYYFILGYWVLFFLTINKVIPEGKLFSATVI